VEEDARFEDDEGALEEDELELATGPKTLPAVGAPNTLLAAVENVAGKEKCPSL